METLETLSFAMQSENLAPQDKVFAAHADFWREKGLEITVERYALDEFKAKFSGELLGYSLGVRYGEQDGTVCVAHIQCGEHSFRKVIADLTYHLDLSKANNRMHELRMIAMAMDWQLGYTAYRREHSVPQRCPTCGHIIGGWSNSASAENGKKGGRPRKNPVVK